MAEDHVRGHVEAGQIACVERRAEEEHIGEKHGHEKRQEDEGTPVGKARFIARC